MVAKERENGITWSIKFLELWIGAFAFHLTLLRQPIRISFSNCCEVKVPSVRNCSERSAVGEYATESLLPGKLHYV